MIHDTHFDVGDVQRLISVGRQTVIDAIHAKKLKAAQEVLGRHTWLIAREDLIQWFLDGGWSHEHVRCIMLPWDGQIVLGGDPRGPGWDAVEDIVREATVVGVGLVLSRTAAKAVVIDLVTMPRALWDMAEFARRVDRPVLVGLIGVSAAEEYDQAYDVFDLVFNRERSAGKVLGAVDRLLKWQADKK